MGIFAKKDPEEPQEWRGAVEKAIETSSEVLKIALEVFMEDLHESQPGRVLGGGDGQDLTSAVSGSCWYRTCRTVLPT